MVMKRASVPIRVGLIGAGMIGRLRARALQKTPELTLVAVADLRTDLARSVASLHPGARIVADGAALASDSEIDAILLSTPPASHEPLGTLLLRAGKHVLCEKPLAITAEACQVMIRAAEEAGVSLATGFNLRYTRAAQLARELLDEGAIGELDHIRAFHGHPGGQEFTHDWVHDRAVTGGGTLMDNGIHLIDLTRWFLGDVEHVVGFATNHCWKMAGCEDNGFLLLKSSEGCVATLQASWTEWRGYGYRLEVYGTEGFIRFGYPPLFLVHGRRRPDRTVGTKRFWFPFYQVWERLRGSEWGLVETLVTELREWARALAGGAPAPISGRDGLEAVRIAQSAQPMSSPELPRQEEAGEP